MIATLNWTPPPENHLPQLTDRLERRAVAQRGRYVAHMVHVAIGTGNVGNFAAGSGRVRRHRAATHARALEPGHLTRNVPGATLRQFCDRNSVDLGYRGSAAGSIRRQMELRSRTTSTEPSLYRPRRSSLGELAPFVF